MPPHTTRTRPRGSLAPDAGATSVLGEILMIAAFVALAGFAASIVWPDEPQRHLHADLVFDLTCTDGSWGDSNDAILLQHRGGEAVEADLSEIVVTIDGIQTRIGSSVLAGPFTDGHLATGETWTHQTPLAPTSEVRVELVYAHLHGDTQLKAAVLEDRTCPASSSPLPGAVFDPGFAYEDADGDCLYTAGVDTPVDDADIQDGQHTAAPGNGLVIPPSVGPVSVPGEVIYASSGSCMVVATPVDSINEKILLDSGGGDLFIQDASVDAAKEIDVRTGGGDVSVTASQLTSDNEHLVIDTDGGAFDADGIQITTQKSIDIRTDGGVFSLESGQFTSDNEHLFITTVGGDIQAAGVTVTVEKTIDIRSDGADIDLSGATLHAINEYVSIDAQVGGAVTAPNASLHAGQDLTVLADGAMDLQGTVLRSDNGAIVLDKDSNANTLSIEDAEVYEPNDNDKADVQPNHNAGVTGSPAVGDLE